MRVSDLLWAAPGCQSFGPPHEQREAKARTFNIVRLVHGDMFQTVYDGELTSARQNVVKNRARGLHRPSDDRVRACARSGSRPVS